MSSPQQGIERLLELLEPASLKTDAGVLVVLLWLITYRAQTAADLAAATGFTVERIAGYLQALGELVENDASFWWVSEAGQEQLGGCFQDAPLVSMKAWLSAPLKPDKGGLS